MAERSAAAEPAVGGSGRTGGGPLSDLGGRRWRLRHLPLLLGVSGAFVGLGALVGWFTAGGDGAAGAALGVFVVAASYTLSTLMIAWADSINPQLVLPFGLGTYIAKAVFFGGVMVAAQATGWAGLVPLAWGIVAGVVGWTGAQIWWIAVVHAPAHQARTSR